MKTCRCVRSLSVLTGSAWLMLACGGGGKDSKGGVVGFETGSEQPGLPPSDGSSPNAPVITSASATTDQITEGAPLVISVGFVDPQGDLASVNLGVASDSTYNTLAATSAGAASSGTLTLSLYPKNYLPGDYILLVSLADKAGNSSVATTIPFSILDRDGSRPKTDAALAGGPDSGAGRDAAVTSGKDSAPGRDTAPVVSGSAAFIMGSRGDSTTKEPQRLVKVTFAGGTAQIAPLSDLVPDGLNRNNIDYRKGRVAMVIAQAAVPANLTGRGRVVAFDMNNPASPWFVPIPTASEGYYYDIGGSRPQVLDDGRIVLEVVHQTDTPYDDYSGQQLAIWDPVKDTLELQGLLDGFIMAQPEVQACECDAEGGHMVGNAFAVTRDGRYAYLSATSHVPSGEGGQG